MLMDRRLVRGCSGIGRLDDDTADILSSSTLFYFRRRYRPDYRGWRHETYLQSLESKVPYSIVAGTREIAEYLNKPP